MLRRLGLGLLLLVAAGSAWLYLDYRNWRNAQLQALLAGSAIAHTSVGDVEYVLRGDAGPVLLFLHGTPGGYDQAPPAEPGYRVLAPSRPGYLRTPLSSGATPAQQARALAALLDSLDISQAMIMGASGGGPAALSFALLFPERTLGLIAMEAVTQPMVEEPPGMPDSDFVMWLMLRAISWLQGPEGLVAMLIPDAANQRRILDDPGRLQRFSELLWQLWPPSLRRAGSANDLTNIRQLHLPLERLDVPTLIIHGSADTSVPFGHARLLAAAVPGATLHVIEGADHMMPFTHEDEVNAVVERFVAPLWSAPPGV